jgi:hypothetical protein
MGLPVRASHGQRMNLRVVPVEAGLLPILVRRPLPAEEIEEVFRYGMRLRRRLMRRLQSKLQRDVTAEGGAVKIR